MQYKVIKVDGLTEPHIRVGDVGEYVDGGNARGQLVRLRINGFLIWFFGDEVVKL